MNSLKMMQKKFVLIIALALLLLLSGCAIPPTPKWNAFCEELMSDYPEITSIKLSATNSPSLPVHIIVDHADIETNSKIAKEIVFFVLSEDGYPEMLGYYEQRSRQPSEFSAIWVYFCDEEDYPSYYTRYYSKREWPIEEGDKMRGFNNWSLWLMKERDTILINFDEIGEKEEM
jgi:hypothetical protein